MDDYKTVSISQELAERIKKGRSTESLRSSAITSIERFLDIEEHAIRAIAKIFKENELMFFADVFNGQLLTSLDLLLTNNYVHWTVVETLQLTGEGQFEKWDIKKPEKFRERVRDLSKIEQIGILFFTDRFWQKDGGTVEKTIGTFLEK